MRVRRICTFAAALCLTVAGGAPRLEANGTGSIPGEHVARIVALTNRGVALMDQYDPVGAAAAFHEVVQLAPEWTTGRLNLGIALLNTQRDEDVPRAQAELERVLAAEPDNVRAHYTLGVLLRYRTAYDEARQHFARVLAIDPQDADTHYQLGTLLAGTEPDAAREHFERALALVPHHESAAYRLLALRSQAGDAAGAQDLLQVFQQLKSTESGVSLGMEYGRMGRYADVVRAFDGAPAAVTSAPPHFRNVAADAGLAHAAPGPAGLPGEHARTAGASLAAAFGPGIAAGDVDGDGDLDLFIPSADPAAGGGLYRNDGGRFAAVAGSGIDGAGVVAGYFGDYDADGDPDLYVTRAGANRLYQNDGTGTFTDVTDTTGTAGGAVLSLGAAWADADHDGDLDVYVANYAPVPVPESGPLGAPNNLWRNNGDGTFTDVAPGAGIDGGATPTTGVTFFDADDDRDLDLYVVNDGAPNRLFANDRIGRYTDRTSAYGALADPGPGLGALLGDVDLDGREDVLLLRGGAVPLLLRNVARGQFVPDRRSADVLASVRGAVGGALLDVDWDGDLDCMLFGVGSGDAGAHALLLNDGTGRFASPVPFGAATAGVTARGAVAADFDGDGVLEAVVAHAGGAPELWRTDPPPGRHWLEVAPVTTRGQDHRPTMTGVGLHVEVKAGQRLMARTVGTAGGYLGGPPIRAHFGLGAHAKADYIRLVWPDAVLQSELEVPADQSWRITQMKRKPSSCPVLFAWDGTRFAFVTDFLGVGGLGFFMTPGEYAPPDPTEAVRIPPELVAQRDGRYVLRIAEPLEEVVYLDHLSLRAYDHPAGWEVHPDERMAVAPPWPTGEPFAVAEKLFPESARTDRGVSVLDRVRKIDRRYVEPPLDLRFVGYAEDHWVELDFGTQLAGVPPDARIVLYAYSWVEYTYSHVNYAAYQAGLAMQPPSVEVPDGAGGWRVAMAGVGYPAGLPRMMTLDVSALPLREDGRLRLRTNMEIFWDQIFLGVDRAGPELRTHTLKPVAADLRAVGYPREYSPDGGVPTLYDYHRLDPGVPFKNFTGTYTRFGDVRPLLDGVDDRFVIMGRGEEIALEFDATALPALPDGWARTLVLYSDGYCKDMDLYTAYPDTVEPMPFHGMANYPPLAAAPGAVAADGEWHTRRIAGR